MKIPASILTGDLLLSVIMIIALPNVSLGQSKGYVPDPSPVIQQRLEDWQDLKFGLLMHWGPYSQWGIVESWSICPEDLSWATGGRKKHFADNYFDYLMRYEGLQTTFNPFLFDPDKWASAAREAGMKYMIFTTKHHDGFCMFDTRYTNYKITDPLTPFSSNPRSNVTKEIFDAFRGQDFWVGAYFSKPDWHSDYYWWDYFPPVDRNPNYSIAKHPEQWAKFVEFTHGQIDELMTGYGKVDILWLDGGWVRMKTEADVEGYLLEVYEGSRYARNPQSQDIRMADLVSKAREKQPELIVVDRDVPGPYQNYLTPEQHIPREGLPYPWETCMTMASSWSYTPNDKYKSTEKLLELLVDVVSKGGNLLLNIGPDWQGDFHPEAYERLKEIGEWMNINGEAIYGSRRYKNFAQGEDIRFTQSKDGSVLYAFLFNFPQKQVIIENLPWEGQLKVGMLGYKSTLKSYRSGNNLVVSIPTNAQNSSKHIWVLKIEKIGGR